MTTLTKSQIIDETVEFYQNNPRAVTLTEGCRYRNSEGNCCAVGRCMTDEFLDEHGSQMVTIPHIFNTYGLDCNLKPQYRGHDVHFWEDLQLLHDKNDNWDGRKLTTNGRQVLNNIKEDWVNNECK